MIFIKTTSRAVCLAVLAAAAAHGAPAQEPALEPEAAARFVHLALACVHREYPNHLSHTLASDADARPPRELTPAFYGCYDWHSSVHGHWLLARLARTHSAAPWVPEARAALAESLTPERLAGETAYFRAAGRASFERPYGLAWLLTLSAELRAWDDPDARRWADALEPLVAEVRGRVFTWLGSLAYPIRSGEHDQTAFSFGLFIDAARVRGDTDLAALIAAKSRVFYGGDRNCPLAYEPSGEDFLSPCLAEADLMRRVLDGPAFARWLSAFLPPGRGAGRLDDLAPARVTDRSDPKLAHLDGLNLSRAWMLAGIAAALPHGDPRARLLEALSRRHADAALPEVTGAHYEGGHWLGTFATYLVTGGGAATSAR